MSITRGAGQKTRMVLEMQGQALPDNHLTRCIGVKSPVACRIVVPYSAPEWLHEDVCLNIPALNTCSTLSCLELVTLVLKTGKKKRH